MVDLFVSPFALPALPRPSHPQPLEPTPFLLAREPLRFQQHFSWPRASLRSPSRRSRVLAAIHACFLHTPPSRLSPTARAHCFVKGFFLLARKASKFPAAPTGRDRGEMTNPPPCRRARERFENRVKLNNFYRGGGWGEEEVLDDGRIYIGRNKLCPPAAFRPALF